jgi:hypothetical protein
MSPPPGAKSLSTGHTPFASGSSSTVQRTVCSTTDSVPGTVHVAASFWVPGRPFAHGQRDPRHLIGARDGRHADDDRRRVVEKQARQRAADTRRPGRAELRRIDREAVVRRQRRRLSERGADDRERDSVARAPFDERNSVRDRDRRHEAERDRQNLGYDGAGR